MEFDNGGSKKRKICLDDQEDQEDEAKMEIFFALVRSMRETRDRWINFKTGDTCKEENNKDIIIPVWKPTFQVEDFMEDQEAIKCPNPDQLPSSVDLLAGAPSQRNNLDYKQEDSAKKGIDLSLSL